MKVAFGSPLSTEGLTTRDANALTVKLRAEVNRLYYTYSDLKSADNPEFPDDAPAAYPESL